MSTTGDDHAMGNEPSGEWLQSRSGERFAIRIPASATNGGYSVTEILSSPGDSTPVHLHEKEDEHILVVEGTARVLYGDKTFDATAGTVVSLAWGIPHAWGNPTDTPLRMVITSTPGGVEEVLRLIATSVDQLDLAALANWPSAIGGLRTESTRGVTEMSHKGFSHIGLSTLDLDKTREFYEGVLGFKAVVADTINVKEGGRLRHMFFDVGRDQLIAFLEPQGVPDVPAKYDAGINRGLGVPAGFYHFAFEAGSAAALAEKRDELRARGVETTDIVDHGWAQSIYFKDPNGLSLEYCCMTRNLTEDDATMQERFTIPRGALDLSNALKVPAAQSTGGTRKA